MEKNIDLKSVLNFALERFDQEVKIYAGEVIPTLLEILEGLAASKAFDRGLVFGEWKFFALHIHSSPKKVSISMNPRRRM